MPHLLGMIEIQRGQPAMAVELIGRAIALTENHPVAEFHNNMGSAYRALNRMDELGLSF